MASTADFSYMQILEPWFATTDLRLVEELRRELRPGHVLEGIEVSAIGQRKDRDDILYALQDGSNRVAVVHLTYSKSSETSPSYPTTRLFANLELWLEYMSACHAAWVQEDSDGLLSLKEMELSDKAGEFDKTREDNAWQLPL